MAKALCLRLDVQSNPLRPWLLMFQVIIRLGKKDIKSNMWFQCGGIHFSVYIVMILATCFVPPHLPLYVFYRFERGVGRDRIGSNHSLWEFDIQQLQQLTQIMLLWILLEWILYFYLANLVNLTPDCALICAAVCAAFHSHETENFRYPYYSKWDYILTPNKQCKIAKKDQAPIIIISTCSKMHADVLRGSNCTPVCPLFWQIVRKQRSLQRLWSVHSCKWTGDEGARQRVPSEGKRKWHQMLNWVLGHSWEGHIVKGYLPFYLPASSCAVRRLLLCCSDKCLHALKCCYIMELNIVLYFSRWVLIISLPPPPPPHSVLHVPPVGTGLSPGIDFTMLTAACSVNTTDLQHS